MIERFANYKSVKTSQRYCQVFMDHSVYMYNQIPKYSSLSTLLLQTDLPSSSTLVHNYSWCFKTMLMACDNAVVSAVSSLI